MAETGKAKTITIISGKGGTGKTSVTAAFASLAAPVVVADCDVDAANLHLLLSPEVEKIRGIFTPCPSPGSIRICA